MGRSLYEITEEIQQLNAIVDSFDPDFEREGAEQSLLQWVGEIGEEHDRKIDAYVAVIREYEYEEAACRTEAERLRLKAVSAQGNIARLKAAMFGHMKKLEGEQTRNDTAHGCDSEERRAGAGNHHR
jgi:hypothetical protein